MNFLQVSSEIPSIQPATIFSVGNWPITNTILMSWLVIFLVIIICVVLNLKLKAKPGKFQNTIEIFYEGILGLVDQITGERKYSEKIMPLIGSLIVFIGFSNLIGLVPVLTSITFNGAPIFRTPSNDFNLTFSLAFGMIILTQVISIRDWGLLGHLGKYFKFKEVVQGFRKGFSAGILSIVDFFIGLLDIVTEFAKVISLSFRLFGNMYAGEIMAAVILGSLAWGLPSIWLAMNLLTAVVQTIVFGLLSAAYYMMAVKIKENQDA